MRKKTKKGKNQDWHVGRFLPVFNKFVFLGLILLQNFVPNTFELKGWHPKIPLRWGILPEIREKTKKIGKKLADMWANFWQFSTKLTFYGWFMYKIWCLSLFFVFGCKLRCLILEPRLNFGLKTSLYVRLNYIEDWFVCDVAGIHKCKNFVAYLLLRWIPGVFINPGTYHFYFSF